VALIITFLEDLVDSIDIESVTQNIIAKIEKYQLLLSSHDFKYQSDN